MPPGGTTQDGNVGAVRGSADVRTAIVESSDIAEEDIDSDIHLHFRESHQD